MELIVFLSISGILRIIMWILIISFLVRFVARLALPYVVKKASEKMQERFNASARQQERPPGDIRVDHTKKTSGSEPDPGGDYVDFKEVRD